MAKPTEMAVLLIALALRLSHLSAWSLNNDEVAQATWSSLPFLEMMREVRRDAVHPPFDYLVQFAVGRMGPDWVRRLPAALAGAGTVAMVLMLGRLWVGRGAALAGGFLIAVSPAHIYYSQEVRPYSLAMFLILASLAALEVYVRDGRARWAAAWSVLVFLAGATLYFGGLVAAAAGFFRIFLDRNDRLRVLWRRLPLIVFAWTVCYSPWLGVVRHASSIPSPGGRERLDWSWWSVRMQSLGAGNERVYEAVTLGSWAFWLSVAIGVALSTRNRLLAVAAFTFIGGTALEILVLQIHPHFSSVRYLAPAWPASFVLAGAGIVFLFNLHWASKPLAVALLVVFTGHAGVRLAEYYRGERSDWGGLVSCVHRRAHPGERVIGTNNWVMRNFGYHFTRMPERTGIVFERYHVSDAPLTGPAWIVSGGCAPRPPLERVGLMKREPNTEWAEIRYLRPGQSVSATEELCPE